MCLFMFVWHTHIFTLVVSLRMIHVEYTFGFGIGHIIARNIPAKLGSVSALTRVSMKTYNSWKLIVCILIDPVCAVPTTRNIFGFWKRSTSRVRYLGHHILFSGGKNHTRAPGITHLEHIRSTTEADK